MASEEDQEVFEITDFTTATEWERFIAQIEEIIHEWKLTTVPAHSSLQRDSFSSKKWKKTSQEICFADTRFNMVHHCLELDDESPAPDTSPEEIVDEYPLSQALEDMMSMENDFPCRAHCLSRWYGLREFVVVAPVVYVDAVMNESRAKLLLSSVCIAANNSNCFLPFFIQLHQPHESFYLGICEKGGIRTNFEMVHLKKGRAQCNHLAGLLEIFKEKLASPSISKPVIISVRFTYVLQEWSDFAWPQQPPDFDLLMGEVGLTNLGELPFGACEDPVSELHLSATWPCLSEDMVVESDISSDLDPLQAPTWTVRIQTIENPQCLLHDYLLHFFEQSRHCAVDFYVGKTEADAGDNYSQPLDRLTDIIPFPLKVTSVVSQSARHLRSQKHHLPIPGNQLQPILFHIFPDAQDDQLDGGEMCENGDALTPASESSVVDKTNEAASPLTEAFRNFKSAPAGSLTYNLAICLCHVNYAYKGLEAVAHLWNEFLLEIRYRWDIACPLPNLDPGVPNLGSCLLHQKLQMLNCCIDRKRAREQRSKRSWSSRQSSILDDDRDDGSSSDEEFYECFELKDSASAPSGGKEDANPSSVSSNASLEQSFKDSLTHQPDGRLRRCGDLCLLHSDKPLYIPVTQEPTPMTEDLLEEHAEVLVQLGTNAEGAQLRAKMQSVCLLSDMEAFKAANPTCCLEDFVRWYSPRDWVEDEAADETSGKAARNGHLSARMLIPGNVWEEAWHAAKPVPARRQKRLFDDTTEAEKVLHWMASLKPAQVVMQLMPVLIHAALVALSQINEPVLNSVLSQINEIAEKATKVMRSPRQEPKKYVELMNSVSQIEIVVARYRSLWAKFSSHLSDPQRTESEELESFLMQLLQKPEVDVKGGSRSSIGTAIHKMFVKAQRAANMLIDESPTSELPPTQLQKRQRSNSLTGRHPALSEFPKPAGREYIIRTTVPRPAPYSLPTPQRMFCVLQQDDIRLAGAFSEDSTFQ